MSKEYDKNDRKLPLADDTQKKIPGKKNTRKWCKGKVGRDHNLAIRDRYFGANAYCYTETYCTRCHKVVSWQWLAGKQPGY